LFQSIDVFLIFLLQSDNELLMSQMHKKLGVTVFVSEIKGVEFDGAFSKKSNF